MPYKNWDLIKNIAGTLEIYRVNDVVTNLKMLRHDIINRQVGADSLQYTQINMYLISKDTRIPDDEHFLCDGIGLWSLFLDKLSLSVRSHLDIIFCGVTGDTNFDRIKEFEDQSLHYIHKILELLYSMDGVLTQVTLEKKYSLEWVEEHKDQKPIRGILKKTIENCNTSDEMKRLIEDKIYQSIREK